MPPSLEDQVTDLERQLVEQAETNLMIARQLRDHADVKVRLAAEAVEDTCTTIIAKHS